MPNPSPDRPADATAKFLLVMLSLAWGLTWPAMRIALDEVSPFILRTSSLGLGALTLFAFAGMRRRDIVRPRGAAIAHTFIAPLFNAVLFGLLANFAQLGGSTGRVAILAYTMPIWTSILARVTLGERFTPLRTAGLVLCAVGIAVLIYPLARSGLPSTIVFALGAALSWAIGTVYLKWARMTGDPTVNSAWQLAAGFLIATIITLFFEGGVQFGPLQARTVVAILFSGMIGAGAAYFLWYEIVGRLPATTAGLGSLSVPAVGVLSSAVVLGEWPTLADIVGFALILAAACCVLLHPGARPAVTARVEPTAQ